MAHQGVTDEQMAWLQYTIGWTSPEILRMLDSGDNLLRCAALGVLQMAEISEETFRKDMVDHGFGSV